MFVCDSIQFIMRSYTVSSGRDVYIKESEVWFVYVF